MVLLVDDEGDVPAAPTQRRLPSSALQNKKEERCYRERLSAQWVKICTYVDINDSEPLEPIFEKRGCYIWSQYVQLAADEKSDLCTDEQCSARHIRKERPTRSHQIVNPTHFCCQI
jgi:hypothetical protein